MGEAKVESLGGGRLREFLSLLKNARNLVPLVLDVIEAVKNRDWVTVFEAVMKLIEKSGDLKKLAGYAVDAWECYKAIEPSRRERITGAMAKALKLDDATVERAKAILA